MEVMIASLNTDFDFSGARTSPYLSAPSSPKRFGEYYLSAPTSPSRLSDFYRDFDYFSSSSIPFGWEEKPGTPRGASKSKVGDDDDGDDNDFAFFVSQESEKSSLSAEELFDGGKIKPLKPPPRLEAEGFASPKSPLLSPRQPRSPIAQGKKIIRDAFSPRKEKETDQRRGRDRNPAAVLSSSNSGRRATRSQSPYRVSRYMLEEERDAQQQSRKEESSSNSRPGALSNPSSSKSSRKWSLRDILLFRSASEGANKDPTRKYSVLYRKPEDSKNSSFKSIDSQSPGHGLRRKGRISAHELHYTMKKAESQDLKKKTFLPYKQGILGRLAGLGSLTR
ncbi:hypothetical protein L6164_015415 [Bauhinia variegata]|uniref:Uncharacterized protein n=1 Tax=Bauhinia variegata TaxID=167791 RepID=A0ACB9NMG7_BAUVA|nr:hypothetical protein L6164_015415 [Bauhinia variegata]